MYKRQMEEKKLTCELKKKKKMKKRERLQVFQIKKRENEKQKAQTKKNNEKKNKIKINNFFFCMWNHFYFISHFSSLLHGILLFAYNLNMTNSRFLKIESPVCGTTKFYRKNIKLEEKKINFCDSIDFFLSRKTTHSNTRWK